MTDVLCYQGDSKTQRRRSTRAAKRNFVEAQPAVSAEDSRKDRKRVRIGVVSGSTGQHVIAALRKMETMLDRPPPGTLLLAQDPRSLNR